MNSSLTPAQKHLIHWLKFMNCSVTTVLGIMMDLDTWEKQDKMMAWMCKHSTATPQQLSEIASQISRACDLNYSED